MDSAPVQAEFPAVDRRSGWGAAVAALGLCVATITFTRYAPGPNAGVAAFLALVVVVVAAVDIERRIIPNRIVLPALGLLLLARAAFQPSQIEEYVLSGLAAGGVFLIPNVINRSLMGMGDVKLALLLGVGLGWSVSGALMIAFLCVFPVAVGVLVRGGLEARRTTLPFGPFLAIGALVVVLFPHLFGA